MTRRSLGTFRDVALGWMFQTSVAALQLIDSGILDARFLEDSTTPAVARQIYANRVPGLRLSTDVSGRGAGAA